MKTAFHLALIGAIGLLMGCSTTPDTVANGDSVRALVAAQTFDPAASDKNGLQPPDGTDPDRASAAIQAMRAGVAKSVEAWGMAVNAGSGAPTTRE
ncbi:MAG: hypothetical protein ABIT61_14140 [Steroidobacteraceae bacterium]